MRAKQPELSRALLALLFAAAFLANGGLGLWAGLSVHHVAGLTIAVLIMGMVALAGAVQQFAKARVGN